MLGLCTICGAPVEQNKQYCHECQIELDAAYEEHEREMRADSAEIDRWLAGDDVVHGARQGSHQRQQNGRQHENVWRPR